jgi:hypothetical protein
LTVPVSTTAVKTQQPAITEARSKERKRRGPAKDAASRILDLQRVVGNRAVNELLSSNIVEGPRDVPLSVYRVLQQGGGQPLDIRTRRWMESRFGEDFGRVRVHTDLKAAEAAKSIHAKAYTIGQDIFFGSGNFQPESVSGKRLIAHELAHVLQGRGGNSLYGNPVKKLSVGQRNSPFEQEAERAVIQVIHGEHRGHPSKSGPLIPHISPMGHNIQAVLRFPDVEPDMLESDKKRTFRDPATGAERKVYDSAKGGYAKNPSSTELSSIVKNGKVGGGFENGKFMYVVDENGKVIVGKRLGESMPHPTLIGGKNPKIQAAGTVEIQGGKIVHVDNHSGHYKPPRASLKSAVKSFMKLDEKVFKNLKVWSFHFEQGKESFKRFYSMRLLKLKKFDIQQVLKKFRWTSIKGRMRSRGFRSKAKGIAGLIAIIVVDLLLSKWLGSIQQEFEQKIIKRDLEKEEPKVRATLEKALEAKMDELDELLEKNPDAKIYVNVRYRFGRLTQLEVAGPDPSGEYEDTPAVELQFVDAGFSNTPWTDTERIEFETLACGMSRIEWQPITLSEEIPVKELFEYEETPGEETEPGAQQTPEKESLGEK